MGFNLGSSLFLPNGMLKYAFDFGWIARTKPRLPRLCAIAVTRLSSLRSNPTVSPQPPLRRSPRRRHAQPMASLPLTDQPAADKSPTKVEHDDSDNSPGSPGRLENRRPAATIRQKKDQPSDNPDAHTLVKSGIRPRRRHAFTGAGGNPPSSNLLTRALGATRRFVFAEDKTLHQEYVPNYRCTSSLSLHPNPWLTPFCQVFAHPERPNRPFRHSP